MSFSLSQFDLSGRVAAVTGGNRGIGRAVAMGVARAGASVAILSRNPQKNSAVVAELEALGAKAIALTLDVTKRDTLAAILAEVEAGLGGIDILINNAGVAEASGGVLVETEAVWDNTMATHLDATFLMSKIAANSMITRRRGKDNQSCQHVFLFRRRCAPIIQCCKGCDCTADQVDGKSNLHPTISRSTPSLLAGSPPK